MSETPQSRWKTAWSYLLSIKHLASESPDVHSHHSPAIYLLGGFVLELGFKAFLSGRGATFKFDHDLNALYSDYLRQGGEDDPGLAGMIDMMAVPHKRHFWRYMPNEEQLLVPTPAALAKHLEPFLISIANQVSGGPEYSEAWLAAG
ncbi:hypothetical protein [Caulobacter vibrioides]|uniref:hypothetical protein n=1 Tax=Caulobacter vibrioides TaxID=155892 RepID=UPI000BB4B6DA|nr:hypothetical protein [Caulobacter vibrioides]ATC25227.1 hypothetical protein CA608_12145 [Caulobacter vibrioides]PLR13997.1 hypothetical protein CVUC_05445 [Caulobacter vibrioides]